MTLTAEDRAAEVRQVAVEEAGLSAEAGDTLADIFTQAAPEGVDPAAFAAVNGYFYQAGERGLPFDKVRESIPAGAWSAARGTEEIAQYAYNRGRMKTLAQEAEAERRQREAERKAAEQAQLARELVNDEEYQDYRDFRKWLRGQTLTISRSDAAGIADFNDHCLACVGPLSF